MRSTREISNSDDIIDSRDVIARIEALQSERERLVDAIADARTALDESELNENDEARMSLEDTVRGAESELIEWDADDGGQELKALLALADEAEGYADDWKYGAFLIRESYFTEYAEQLAEDIGDYDSRDVKWPYTCIDWEKAADELRGDYTAVYFSGVAYLVR